MALPGFGEFIPRIVSLLTRTNDSEICSSLAKNLSFSPSDAILLKPSLVHSPVKSQGGFFWAESLTNSRVLGSRNFGLIKDLADHPAIHGKIKNLLGS